MTYPNGKTLGYRYDATGRLIQLDWDGAPLITDITWNPMGQPTGWSWAFVAPALRATRQYDSAARLFRSDFAVATYDGAGRITQIAQLLARPGSGPHARQRLGRLRGLQCGL